MSATVLGSSGRVLGLDLGERRIGVAVCDAGRRFATPLIVIERSGDLKRDHNSIARLVADEEAVGIVVGMPIDLAGQPGPAAASAAKEVEILATVMSVPVHMHDERMTTAVALKSQRERGVSVKKGRSSIDKEAAAVMLQSWLDSFLQTEAQFQRLESDSRNPGFSQQASDASE